MSDRLYRLLPAIHRQRDREQGEPLRGLLATIEHELDALEANVDALYDDAFIETCRDWVVPYLAELIGLRVLGDRRHALAHPRAQVAGAVALRRLKGTPLAIERASRDVTGWFARLVELFERLAHTQNVQFQRPERGGLFDVRSTGRPDPGGIDPFAATTRFHTVDIRRAGTGRGRFNLTNLALHLWRLRVHSLTDAPAIPRVDALLGPDAVPGHFHVDALGRDLQLFHRPETDAALVRQAEPRHLPVPLELDLLDGDVQGYRRRWSGAEAELRAENSDFYGPARGLDVAVDGVDVPTLDVVSRNLDAWGAVGLVSGDLGTFPDLPKPRLAVTLGTDEREVALADLPDDLSEAAELLEQAIRVADTSSRFADARVVASKGRLLVLSGDRGEAVAIDAAAEDATTAENLALTLITGARSLPGLGSAVRSEPLPLTPPLTPPTVSFSFGTDQRQVFLADLPADRQAARRLLQAGLRAASSDPSDAFAEARVAVRDGHLIVVPGSGSVSAIAVDTAAPDVTTAGELGLLDSVGAESTIGVLSGPATGLDPSFVPRLRISVASVSPPSVPMFTVETNFAPSNNLDEVAASLEVAIRTAHPDPAFRGAVVVRLGRRLFLRTGTPGTKFTFAEPKSDTSRTASDTATDLGLIVDPPDQNPDNNPRTTAALRSAALPEAISLSMAPRVGLRLDGEDAGTVVFARLPSDLEDLATDFETALRRGDASADLVDARVIPDGTRLLIVPGVDASLAVEDVGVATTATELGLDPAGASPVRVLLSAPLAPFPRLSVSPSLDATIGDDGPHRVTLRRIPGDVSSLRVLLEEAIRRGHASEGFAAAKVAAVGDRVVIVSGRPGDLVVFAAAPDDASTVTAIGLDADSAGRASGVLSGVLEPFPTLRRPTLAAAFGGSLRRPVVLADLPVDLGSAARLLEAALRRADATPTFRQARVITLSTTLLVLPGDPRDTVTFELSADDASTAGALALLDGTADGPAMARRGLLSGPLTPFPSLSGGRELVAIIDGIGQTIFLEPPTDPDTSEDLITTARTLQAALRMAPDPGARVAVVDDRLLVLPSAGLSVRFEAEGNDATVRRLGLDSGAAVETEALESGDLPAFPATLAIAPRLRVEVDGAIADAVLATVPRNLSAARQVIETAIRTATSDPMMPPVSDARFADAQVIQVAGRLLVLPGVPGLPIAIGPTTGDATTDDETTARLLDLAWRLAIDPVRGRLRFAPGAEPTAEASVRLAYATGFAAALGSGPYDRRDTLTDPDSVAWLREVDAGGGADFESVADAIDAWQSAGRPDGLIRIRDNAIYREPLTIDLPAGSRLAIEAADGTRPVLQPVESPRLVGSAEGKGGALTVNGLLVDAGLDLVDNLDLTIEHTTLAPRPARPSMRHETTMTDGSAELAVTVSFSVVGSLALPSELASVTLRDSILDAQGADTGASVRRALVSDGMPSALSLSAALAMDVTLGAGDPMTIALGSVPTSLAEAATALETALAAISSTSTADVVGDRLLVRSGDPSEALAFSDPAAGGRTAQELRLVTPVARRVEGLFSGKLGDFAAFTLPRMRVTMGESDARIVELAAFPTSLQNAAALLSTSLADSASPAFSGASVSVIANAAGPPTEQVLLIQPGIAGEAVRFAGTTADMQTIAELGLGPDDARPIHGLLGASFANAQFLNATIDVAVGGAAAVTVSLAGFPATLDDVAAALESALEDDVPGAFPDTETNVLRLGDHLLIRPSVVNDRIEITSDGPEGTSPSEVLGLNEPPAQILVGGRLSAPLAAFGGLTAPRFEVSVDGGGSFETVHVRQIPIDLAAAASAVQLGLREAADAGDPRLDQSEVLAVGRRLLIQVPGESITGDLITARPLASDPDTASELGIILPEATSLTGLLSAPVVSLPDFPRPRIAVTPGSGTPVTVSLDVLPTSPEAARVALDSAIRGAGPADALRDAHVGLVDGGLLVVSGVAGETITVSPTVDDATTATDLGLVTPPARSLIGLRSGRLFPFPDLGRLRLSAGIGGDPPSAIDLVAINLDGPVATLDEVRATLDAGFVAAAADATVETVGARLLVRPTTAGTAVRLDTVPDDLETVGLLALDAAAATTVRGLLSGGLEPFPTLPQPRVTVSLGAATFEATLSALPNDLDEARDHLESAIRQAADQPAFNGASVARLGDRLLVTSGDAEGSVTVEPLATDDPGTAGDLAMTEVEGARTSVRSGDLTVFPALPRPALDIDIGSVSATARLDGLPADVASAAALLEAAIRDASLVVALTGARVIADGDALLVLPGDPADPVTVAVAATDPDTAGELRLLAPDAAPLTGFHSGDLSTFPTITDPPALDITIGTTTHADVAVTGPILDLDGAASALEAAIRGVPGADAAFLGARVYADEGRLLVLPGTVGVTVGFAASASQPATVTELALDALSTTEGLRSGDLSPFPAPLQVAPSVRAILGAATFDAELDRVPTDLADAASALEDALRNVPSAPAALANARVTVQGSRLLVETGGVGDALMLDDLPNRSTTATMLALSGAGGGVSGLLSGDLGAFAGLRVTPTVEVTFGSSMETAVFDGVPTDLESAREALEDAIRAAGSNDGFVNATVRTIAPDLLLVASGEPGEAVTIRDPAGSTATTAARLGLLGAADMGPAVQVDGLLSGDLTAFGGLVAPPPAVLNVTIEGVGTRTVDLGALPVDLEEARERLDGAIRAVPDAAFQATRVVVAGDDRLLIVSTGTSANVAVASTSTNPDLAESLALDGASAEIVPALLGGALPAAFDLGVAPALLATYGTANGPHRAVLRALPRSRAELRALVEQALRRAHTDAAFTGTAVRIVGDRFLVVPGADPGGDIVLADAPPSTPLASALALEPAMSRRAEGLLSDALGLPALVEMPVIEATFGDPAGMPTTLALGATPRSLGEARTALEAAIDAAGDMDPTFDEARVLLVDDTRLLVVPGAGTPVAFDAGGDGTAVALKLAGGEEASVVGLRSAALTLPLSDLSDLAITVGQVVGTVALAALPQDIEQARDFLEAGLRDADSRTSFAAARVHVLDGDRLLIRSGVDGETVQVAAGPMATALGLAPDQATTAPGVLSGPHTTFPGLSAAPRVHVAVDVGGTAPGTVSGIASLASVPGDLDDTRAVLETALRTADAGGGVTDPAFAAVRVLRLGDRLLVEPGGTGVGIDIDEHGASPDTAAELGLSDMAGAERGDGLLSGDLSGYAGLGDRFLGFAVTIDGQGPFAATLERQPADADEAALRLRDAIRAAHHTTPFTSATVEVVVGDRLVITPGIEGSLVEVDVAEDAGVVAGLGFLDPTTIRLGSVHSGNLEPFEGRSNPTLRARFGEALPTGMAPPESEYVEVTLPSLPRTLTDAARALAQGLEDAGFDTPEVDVVAERLLIRAGGVPGRGIFFLAGADDASTILRLRLNVEETVEADGLLSGDLSTFPRFSASPRLLVRMGGEGPFEAILPSLPMDPAQARDSLERAIRASHNSVAFTRARVALATDGARKRLIVLPGADGAVAVDPHPDDLLSARELGFTGSGVRRVRALLSGMLPAQIELPGTSASMPPGDVIISAANQPPEARSTTFPGLGGALDLMAVAAALQGGIRGVDPARSIFARALAAVVDGAQLVLLPGIDDAGISVTGDVLGGLALDLVQAVGTDRTGDASGPPLALERVTVLGRLFVRELVRASEVLFTEPVVVGRRHVGCVRYSYLPTGSQTGRRFRCQPDLALAQALSEIDIEGIDARSDSDQSSLLDQERSREEARILARLEPIFTSRTWGEPGFGQLAETTADEIRAGAENGSEMGAFHLLDEARRREQLRLLIEELLRFGLEAGVFHAT